ncbi:MAG TPA: hypothetical protein VKY40_01645 [Halanaerobiales bacterium]|nr:hypothetical protein [Halanaerobiales bacterium]
MKINKGYYLISLIMIMMILNLTVVYAGIDESDKDTGYQRILSIDTGKDLAIDYRLKDSKDGENIILRAGIDTFTVDENERIYLSNFASGKIVIYHQNKYEDQIDISDLSQPRDILFTGDNFYVFEDIGRITEFSYDDVNIYTIPPGLDKSLTVSLPVRLIGNYQNRENYILYDNHLLYSIEGTYTDFIQVDSFRQDILTGPVYKQIIGIDESGYIYISGIEISYEDDQIEIEELVFKFDKSGELLAVAETLDEKNYIAPYKYLDINSRGDVFQLLVLNDRVKVFKLIFRDINEVKSEKGFRNINISSSSFKENLTVTDDLSFRKELYNRAAELVNYKWIYNPEIHAVNVNEVEIPYYLKGIKTENELRGIPYCWGGFDSLSTRSINQKWDNFPDAVSRGAIIGNAGITPDYFPGTSGLDCSGFISVVLGLKTRRPSWYFFYKNELLKKIKYRQLALMDILVKNGHMFFYLDENDYGITSVESNTLGSEWKVKFFHWPWRTLRDMGYSSRSYKNIEDIAH